MWFEKIFLRNDVILSHMMKIKNRILTVEIRDPTDDTRFHAR